MEFMAIFQSVWTIVVMLAFFGVIAWAYNSKRKDTFNNAANSLIDDDDSILRSNNNV